ncbi:adipocyte plasma membrane-associated protein [Plakobranchus ocellatus]|uniref:Adipocyte plasma membrane-associated protein n=1 Tax=Plakobranchus ocellatus TaxID=259542 RepID=A0AAV4BEL0_9GAST|nr:adipocyte plasma membrane-associated protein [Plakobranchus ocellatus]
MSSYTRSNALCTATATAEQTGGVSEIPMCCKMQRPDLRPACVCVSLSTSGLAALAAVLAIYLIPSPIDPEPIRLSEELPVLKGPLTVNRHLQKVVKLFEGNILGPESFAAAPDGKYHSIIIILLVFVLLLIIIIINTITSIITTMTIATTSITIFTTITITIVPMIITSLNLVFIIIIVNISTTSSSVYTGSSDGKIWRIKENRLSFVARTGIDHPDCGSYELEPQCGRPKGMAVDADGRLLVVDAYKGILGVDLNSGHVEVLLDNFNGSRFLFLNAMDILPNGTIVISESSTKWRRRDYRYEVIEANKLGRVLAFDPVTGKVWLIHDGLYLANGLVLTHDKSALLVAEMSVSRISKIHLAGPRAGQREILVENLPGYPDNIKRNERGNYYVGLGSVRFQGSSPLGSFLDLVGPYPAVKRTITKLIPASLFDVFLAKHAILLEISDDGHIVTSHHDPGATTIMALSEAFQHGENIYIGHFKIPFVGLVKSYDLHAGS